MFLWLQCSTVVEAVVKASSGDRSHVKEYIGIVCGEVELSGWHQERCSEFALSVFDAMSDDLCFHFVRVMVGSVSICNACHGTICGFWEVVADCCRLLLEWC